MNCEGWEETTLGMLLEITSSKRIYAHDYIDVGIPFYRGKEIIEKSKGNDVKTELFISESLFNKFQRKFGAPNKGDIMLTSVGTLGVPYLVRNEIFYFKDGNLTWFRNFSKKCDNTFIYYWLNSSYSKNQVLSKSIGSTQKALTIETLKKFNILIPNLLEQRSIASILSSLDDKIELNHRMNKTLEKIAQTLFKRWFVDFEFPDDNGNPYWSAGGKMVESELGLIPEGWKATNIFENIQEVSKKNKSNKDLPVLSVVKDGAIVSSDDHFTKKVYSKTTTNYKVICKYQVGYNPSRANIGSIAMLEDFSEGLLSPIYVVFKLHSSITPIFFKLFMKNENFINNIQHHSSGTTRQNFPIIAFKAFNIVIPPIEKQTLFDNTILPVNNMIQQSSNEANLLIKIRDTLLPKLMSGEIRVPVMEE